MRRIIPPPGSAKRSKACRWPLVLGWILGGLWLTLALQGSAILSATNDEVPHLGSGLTMLRHGDFRFNPEHPPLFKALACLAPMLVLDPPMQYDFNGWRMESWLTSNQWSWGYTNLFLADQAPQEMLFWARLLPIGFGLVGGILAWWAGWVLSCGSHWAGLLAFCLLLFYPEYLGHARYVTFDVPVLVGGALISWAAYRWWRRPRLAPALTLIVGGALLPMIKLPLVIWTGMVFGLLGLDALARPKRGKHVAATLLLAWTVLVVHGALYWAIAGFRYDLAAPALAAPEAPPNYALPDPAGSGMVTSLIRFVDHQRLLPQLALAPWNHLEGNQARWSILLGNSRVGGWYHYFFVSTWVKTPLTLLLLLPVAIASGIALVRSPRPSHRMLMLCFTVPPLVLFALTVQSRLNIGHRHVLMIYLPWTILGAWGLWHLSRRWRMAGALTLLVGVGGVAESLRVHPHQATYFNAIGGNGPAKGMTWLGDSNIDWGQDVALGAEFARNSRMGKLNIAIFGMNRPDNYGIRDFRFIIPNYEWALGMPKAQPPDPARWSMVSVSTLPFAQKHYPQFYLRQPAAVLNSLLFFPPLQRSSPVQQWGNLGVR